MSGITAPAAPPIAAGMTGPVLRPLAPRERQVLEYGAPSILRVQSAAHIAQADALGFGFLLLPGPSLLPAAQSAGLGLLLELDLTTPNPDSALLDGHPDWFVHRAHGPAFRYLSERDETVDWWDQEITLAQQSGFAGFYIRNAATTPPAILLRLLNAAFEREPETLFIAEVFGASPAQADAMEGLGFSLATTSSCFWDFSAAWLNEDTARVNAIAPAIALAAPPNTSGWSEAATKRAIHLAAGFAPAWMMEAGFHTGPGFDLSSEVAALNALRAQSSALQSPETAQLRSSPGSLVACLFRGECLVILANASLHHTARHLASTFLPALGAAQLHPLGEPIAPITPASALELPPGGILFFEVAMSEPVHLPAPRLDISAPRIAIEAISPQVDDGSFPVRRTVGEMVIIEADLLADGHDKLAGEVLLRAADEKNFRAYKLKPLNNDRWSAEIPLERLGRHVFTVTAWKDHFASFADEVTKKHQAGISTQLELREGMALVEEAARLDKKLSPVLEQLRALPEDSLREALLSGQMEEAMQRAAPRKFLARSHEILLDAERLGASFASWYEIFPRSQSGDPNRHGNFQDVIGQLPRIAAMGFDVLYFPPIHPIGEKNRKGKNNSLTPSSTDPGSPYAIGSAAGGHDAIHPELGTLADFQHLIAAAKSHHLEIALDFAIQCAPDHPWLTEHKDWFGWRPDGSLRYAENPPKKYEDIVNVDFYTDAAKPALWLALRDAVQFWCDQGIRLFRVDNPHTKPFPFWEWLIADIRSRHPDAGFLAEAFTRPKIMARLAKIGFSQSYTYFTWRNTKPELEEYLNELTTTNLKEYFRPNFFVNTPDINPPFLQTSGRAGHLIRAALAATLSGLWGVYNGFELCEATAIPDREEYLNSEKYEIKSWDYGRPGNIVAEITALNHIRKANSALHSHLNIEFLPCNNPNILYFRKHAADGNTILATISLDPHNPQDASIELPLHRFALPDDAPLAAHDLMRNYSFIWHGKYQQVHLNPSELPFCIWQISKVKA
jgi:starch synthase (maltosyl-transferring)